MLVAPRSGAWIETPKCPADTIISFQSHPARVRGLKLPVETDYLVLTSVAPRSGAWIETLKQ